MCPHCGVMGPKTPKAPPKKARQRAERTISPNHDNNNIAWYEGGTLYKSVVYDWIHASYSNRLATSSGYLVATMKSKDPALYELFTAAGKKFFASQLKKNVIRIEACITKAGRALSEKKQMRMRSADAFTLCYLGWSAGFKKGLRD